MVARLVAGIADDLVQRFLAIAATERDRDRACAPALEQLAIHRQLGDVLLHGHDVDLGPSVT